MVKKEALVLAGPGRLRPDKSGIILFITAAIFINTRRQFESQEAVRRLQRGTIKKIMSGRGFGFIELNDEKEIFFHSSDVEGDFMVLEEGDPVIFQVAPGRNGKEKAIKVHKEI